MRYGFPKIAMLLSMSVPVGLSFLHKHFVEGS
jgi:hypothetical protein